MGKKKYIDKILNLFDNSPVVDYPSIERVVREKNHRSSYTKQLIRGLIKNGKVMRITKGYYTTKDNYQLAVFCFKPSYLGLQDALSFHNIWEQETIPVIITTKKIRPGIRKVFGKNILLRKLNKRYFFGYEYLKDNDFYLPYSDIEKTFIDLIYFKQRVDEDTLKTIKSKINKTKLNLYLKKYPKIINKKVNNLLG
ncbi:MAG: hypothetical protein AABX03_00945 [Nanoarchaeota archaeon]